MELKVKEMVEYLNQHIIGQDDAKRQIASMVKNKIRRDNLKDLEWKKNIAPFNGILIGDTGVGKTEIFRRISEILDVAFCKVDISGYTSSGYVGHSVDDIISVHLFNAAKEKIKIKYLKTLRTEKVVLEKIAEGLIEQYPSKLEEAGLHLNKSKALYPFTTFNSNYLKNQLINEIIEILKNEDNPFKDLEISLKIKVKKKLPPFLLLVEEKNKYEEKIFKDTVYNLKVRLAEVEFEKMSDESIQKEIKNLMERGIVFLDEIDKIAGTDGKINTTGVQKELLTLIEGKTVNTEAGLVSTEHILFIGAGAFKISKIDDLLPELLGRMPVRIVLNQLTKEDYKRILIEPKYSLIKRMKVLYESDGIKIDFTQEAINRIAEICYEENQKNENLGARRLQTILALITENIDFEIENNEINQITIDVEYIENQLLEKNNKIKKALDYIGKEITMGFIT